MRTRRTRSLALLCILLVALVGLAEATHFHSGNARLARHDCSLCSLVHAGVLAKSAFLPAPVLARAATLHPADVIARSLLFVLSFCIRPPPMA
jgi:hypothetical protein